MKTLFKLFAALAVLSALAIATPRTAEAAPGAFSAVAKIDGITGDSRILQGGVDILQYSWSLSVSVAGRPGSGRADFAPFHFVHSYDRSSPALFHAAAQGTTIRKIEFYIYKTGGDPTREKVIHVTLENVLISSINVTGHNDLPTEQVTLHYGKISWDHVGGGGKAGWDVPNNVKT